NDDTLASLHCPRQIGFEFPLLCNGHTRQITGIGARSMHLLQMIAIVPPQRNRVFPAVEEKSQGCSPGSRPKHRHSHGVPSRLLRWKRGSVPTSSRWIFPL